MFKMWNRHWLYSGNEKRKMETLCIICLEDVLICPNTSTLVLSAVRHIDNTEVDMVMGTIKSDGKDFVGGTLINISNNNEKIRHLNGVKCLQCFVSRLILY